MKRKECDRLCVPPEGHFHKSLIMRHKNLVIRDLFISFLAALLLWSDGESVKGNSGYF